MKNINAFEISSSQELHTYISSILTNQQETINFILDNIPISAYVYIDIKTIQLLLDNGFNAEDIAKKLLETIKAKASPSIRNIK